MATEVFDRSDIGLVRRCIGAITPNDTLASYTHSAVRVIVVTGTPGNIKVGFPDGSTFTYPAVGIGWASRIEGQFSQVFSTGTTATGLYGLI